MWKYLILCRSPGTKGKSALGSVIYWRVFIQFLYLYLGGWNDMVKMLEEEEVVSWYSILLLWKIKTKILLIQWKLNWNVLNVPHEIQFWDLPAAFPPLWFPAQVCVSFSARWNNTHFLNLLLLWIMCIGLLLQAMHSQLDPFFCHTA